MEIRKARIMELRQVHRLLWQNFQWDSRRFIFFFGKSLLKRNRHIYVCLVDDKIVGFTIIIEGHGHNISEWYLAILVVEEKYRRKGYGRQLLRFVESKARRHGVKKIYLNVDESNPVVRLYQSEGFQRARATIMYEKHL